LEDLEELGVKDKALGYRKFIVSEVAVIQKRIEGFGKECKSHDIRGSDFDDSSRPAWTLFTVRCPLAVHIYFADADPSAVFAQRSEDDLALDFRQTGWISERRV